MSFSEWKQCKLGEVANILSGYAFKSKDFTEAGVPVIKIKNIVPPHVTLEDIQYVSEQLADEKKRYELKYNDVLISLTGSNVNQFASAVGKVGRVKTRNRKLLLNQRVGKFEILDHNRYSLDFLYYCISTDEMRYKLASNAGGAANQANISPSLIKEMLLPLPPISEQEAIAATLSSLDDAVELNSQISEKIEEMAQVIFKSWFVDFEPFKEGEFEESELGPIPKGWRIGTLGEIIEIFDSKRVPLSSRQRSEMKKRYPYYGAASLMDYVDDYIFDGIYVLLGEDGTVMDAKGYPILQYVWGKFWVNNHAHVLKGTKGFSDEFIYMLLKNTNVTGIVTGAVQPKINQGNLTSLKVIIPAVDVIKQYNEILDNLFALRRANTEEIMVFSSLSNSLHPKLMSGEVRVPIEQ